MARSGEDLAAHHRVRHAVFVEEQAVFAGTDRDEWDPAAVHVVAALGPLVVGAVRLYALDEAGLWQGDRLAVLPDARRYGAGGPLVRFAVATAGELGGTRMIARVQEPNVPFFLHLGWARLGPGRDPPRAAAPAHDDPALRGGRRVRPVRLRLGPPLAGSSWPRAGRPAWAGPSSCCEWRGRPLLQYVVDVAAAELDDNVLVVGPEAEAVLAALDLPGSVRVVVNADAAEGQSTSLRAGLAAMGVDAPAALVLLGDQPTVRADAVRAVASCRPWSRAPPTAAGPGTRCASTAPSGATSGP